MDQLKPEAGWGTRERSEEKCIETKQESKGQRTGLVVVGRSRNGQGPGYNSQTG